MRNVRTVYYSRYRPGTRTVVRHEVDSLVLIEHVVLTVAPKLIVELGTAFFGLTALFHETDRSIEIHSFDKTNFVKHASHAGKHLTNDELAIFKRKVFGENVHFYFEGILTENQKVVDLLKLPMKKLLYCDNGDKAKELELYAKYLNKDDVLGVHDWGTGEGISYECEQVKNALVGFTPIDHYNRFFERRNCSSRFFVRD